jgi:hypothetical protein
MGSLIYDKLFSQFLLRERAALEFFLLVIFTIHACRRPYFSLLRHKTAGTVLWWSKEK